MEDKETTKDDYFELELTVPNLSKDKHNTLVDRYSLKYLGTFLSFVLSLFCIYKGFHKMLVYDASHTILLEDNVNAYVGGDAYNFIINANYSTAWFTLAIFCALIGMFLWFVNYLETQHRGKDEDKN